MIHLFHWLAWKDRLPASVLLSAVATSLYLRVLATLDTDYPESRMENNLRDPAVAHFYILDQTILGGCVGAILGVILWRLLLAGTPGGKLACICISAMVFSAYFKALTILYSEQPGTFETFPGVRTDEEGGLIVLVVMFHTLFGFCVGFSLGFLFWRLWLRIKQIKRGDCKLRGAD